MTVASSAPVVSLASLMTGLSPPAHGIRNHPARLSPELDTLAELLARGGYASAAMTRHSWLRRKSGFDQGFAEYHVNKFFAGPYLVLGQILLRKKATDLAIENLSRAVQYDYTNPNAHYLLGRALGQAGQTDEAKREFEISRQLRDQEEKP